MPKYLALLRGINVGGNNLIKMADLKACFEKMKFADVTLSMNIFLWIPMHVFAMFCLFCSCSHMYLQKRFLLRCLSSLFL